MCFKFICCLMFSNCKMKIIDSEVVIIVFNQSEDKLVNIEIRICEERREFTLHVLEGKFKYRFKYDQDFEEAMCNVYFTWRLIVHLATQSRPS
jgi:hypothetical protein